MAIKELKILGKTVLSFGSLTDDSPGGIPGKPTKFLSPRYEPTNITQNADVLRVQSAIRLAEVGDTQELFRFYRDVLLSDDHVQACLETRKLATLSNTMCVLPFEKKNPDDLLLAAAFNQAVDDCENWDMGMIDLMDSVFWPNSIVERLFKPATPGRPGTPKLQYTLRKFVPVNPQLHCYQWAYMTGGVGLGTASAVQLGNLAAELNRGDNVDATISPYTIDLERWEPYLKLWPIDQGGRIIYDVTNACYLDPVRHVVHRGHLMQTFRDNWGGPGRSILMWWLLRGLGRMWFGEGMERYGKPFMVGFTDATDPDAVGLLRDAMDLAKTINGVVLDESSRMELKEAMVAGMAQGYQAFHAMCNEAISFRITGLRESQKPAGLNAGAADFSANVRDDVRQLDGKLLASTVIRQIVNPFAQINGLKGRVKIVWGGLSDADAASFADLLVKMKTAGFTITDDAIDTANERTGLTWQRVQTAPLMPGGQLGAPGAPGQTDSDDDDDGDDGDADPEDGDDDITDDDVTPLSSRLAPRASRLAWLSATRAPAKSPVDDVASAHSAALAQAFRGALAPVRLILLSSTSRADAEKKLAQHFADWPAARIAGIVEEALQVCAAKGAAEGTPK